jgi:hypothetical protein
VIGATSNRSGVQIEAQLSNSVSDAAVTVTFELSN